MLLRGMKLTLVGSGMVLAASAFAEGGAPKFGFEYRTGLTYDDGKIKETDGEDAQSSTSIALEAANLTAEGEAAKNVNYSFGFDLLAKDLFAGNVVMKMNDMIGLYAGKGKVAQGGWAVKDSWTEYSDVETLAAYGYAAALPLETYAASLGAQLNLAGTLSINAFNDVKEFAESDTDGDGEVDVSTAISKNQSDKSQAWTVEWVGNFAGWMPLVQLMAYDLNKSLAASVGVKGSVAGLGLMLNYTSDSRFRRDDMKDVYTQIDFHVDYALSGFTPWLGFHKFDQKQDGTDLKVNGEPNKKGEPSWSDNAQSIALGVNCTAMSNGYVPYLSINSISGTYADAKGAEEDRNGLVVKAGVMGKF